MKNNKATISFVELAADANSDRFLNKNSSILDDFKKLESSEITVNAIMSFISVTNARLVGVIGIDNSVGIPAQFVKECFDFYVYFAKKYGNVKTVSDMITDNWGNDGPLVFRIGRSLVLPRL